MNLEFDKSFEKSLDKIKDKKLLRRIELALLKAEESESIEAIPNTRKLSGFSDYFRIKLGDYRLGFERINDKTIRFIILAHRKDIYKRFP